MNVIDKFFEVRESLMPETVTEQTWEITGNLGTLKLSREWVDITTINWAMNNGSDFDYGMRPKITGRFSAELHSDDNIDTDIIYEFIPNNVNIEPFKIKLHPLSSGVYGIQLIKY